MSARPNLSRAVVLVFALAVVSMLTFAAVGGKLAPLFTGTAASAQSAEANTPATAPLTIGTCDGASNIDVESTGGTALAGYATVKLAFDAINAGTHTGTIIIEICASTAEGATPATLNSSGAGSASYTSINMYPIADGVVVDGAPVTGFGVIQLKGADNVTINGDNPNSGGINRNLTVNNTNTTTAIAGSVIRIATAATVVTSADNDTIKNCILNGNVTAGNAAAITSATGSSNSSFVIYVGGNGGVTATDAPTAITSVTTNTAPTGTTVNNLLIDNNAVNQAARGIVFNGAVATVSTGVVISNNVVGDQGAATPATPPFTSPTTTVYTKGIWVAGTAAVTVSGNTLKNILSYVGTTMTSVEILSPVTNTTISNNTVTNIANNGTVSIVKAILVSSSTGAYTIADNTVTNVQAFASVTGTDGIEVTANSPAGTIERNKIQTVYNRSASTFGAYGLHLTAGTGIVIRNNFVSDINMNMTGGLAFSTTFGVVGIRIAGGTAHKVYHNSVNLFGPLLGTSTTTILTAGFCITVTAITGVDVRNNIFANTMTGGTTGVAHVSMSLPSSGTVAMNLTINNNDYFSGITAGQSGIAHAGGTYTSPPVGPPSYAGLYTAALFNPADTTATTNLRTYTNTLSTAGTNDNASKVVDPLFSFSTDLHLIGTSTMIDMGAALPVTDDIDAQVRPNGGASDIGADEFYPAPGILQLSSSTYSGNEGGTATITVNRTSGSSGTVGATVTVADGTATGGAACTAGVDYINAGPYVLTFGDTVTSQSVIVTLCSDGALFDPNETFSATLSAPTGGATLGSPTAATVTITDVPPPFNGAVSVGTGQNYTSLTNPGGLFEALNSSGATGNVTINIISDLTGESGAVALNEVAGGFTVTIEPSGAARSITSTSGAVAVIKLNDADNVTIDGSLSGGTDRSLSITNTNTAGNTTVIWIGGTTGAQNNTIKNLNLTGGTDQNVTNVFNFAIIASSSSSILTGGTDLDNNTYTNNFIKKVNVGIISIGGLATNMNQNTVISNNVIGPAAFGSDQIGTLGVLIFNENAPQVVSNDLRFIGSSLNTGGAAGRDHVGISLCTGSASWSGSAAPAIVGTVTNGNIARNLIHDISERGTFSSVGIVENCTNGGLATSNTIANNMIYNILANGTSPDQAVGIGISNGNGDKVVYNSIFLTGDADPATATSATQSAFGISVNVSTPVNLTISDNVSVNDISSNTVTVLNSAINIPTGYVWGTGGSNFNDLFATTNPQSRVGTVGGTAGTHHATLASWQTATTQDANSLSVDPLFVSPTNLHIQSGSPVIGMGTAIAGITTDFDGQTRDATPDIGADEFVALVPGTLAFSSATYTVGEAGPTVTLTVNRTGGSDGAVTVDYALGGGTATGGAACGGAVDYVNTGGTVSFANGETSKTFNVAICDDLVYEGNETFDATLSNATGGATIGSPNPATVTITDNETQPTVQFSSATYMTTEAFADAVGPTPGVNITVTLSGPSQGVTTVNYATVAGGTATGGASCAAGVDYINASGTLTFIANDVSETFFVTTCPDVVDEPDETVNLALTLPVGATLGTPNTAVLTIVDNDLPAGNVVVNPGNVAYVTLGDAITAINAGTHTGAVTVDINANTTETGPIVLNSSGAGSASYTSIVIRPGNDGVTVAGPTVTGRGLIELNGADNVTIDGDNPNTAGINRNLSIVNTAAASNTFTSVIRVALSTLITTGNNNSVKNCIINGSATGQNTAAITGTATAVHTTYGILVGGGASTVSATTAPSAIASFATVIAAPITAANFSADNNAIDAAARGIAVMGSAVTVANNLSITRNTIGNASAASTTTVYSRGITVQGFDNTTISGNTFQNIQSFVGTSIMAIGMGNESASGQNALVERNIVNNVNARSLTTFGAYGINLAAGPSITVRNNFVTGITGDMTGGAAFSTTFGLFGIRVGSGNTHKIYHNSVNMFGARVGTPNSSLLAACLAIVSNTQNGLDVRNNIFVNTLTGGTTSVAYPSVYLPASGTAAGMNLTWNNNDYQSGATVGVHGVAHVGTIYTAVPAGPTTWAGLYTIAAFDPTLTTPNANFRAYTSSLSAATTNDNASLKVDPLFVSPTDLHIAVASPMVDAGAAVGVLKDIDLQLRVPPPDIGADEPSGITPPANDIAANTIITPANGSVVLNGSIVSPQASFTNTGSATQTGVNVQFTITGPGGYNYTNTQSIAAIAPEQTVTVTFAAAPAFTTNGAYVTGAAVTTPDSNAGNDTVSGGFTVSSPLSGTYTVGSGGNFSSLTNPGGIFEAINTLGATGNIVIDIISDLTGENGGVALNQIAGGFTVLIKPSGAPRSITGSSTVGIIRLNSADGVTINGSTTGAVVESDVVGGNPALRELTVNNTNAAATAGAVIVVMSGANGAQNNTVKNVNIAGFSPTATLIGIALGGAAPGAAGLDNDNNRVENCSFQRAFIGIYNVGASAANPNTGTVITQNDLSATGANRLRRAGILVFNENGIQITENSIGGITSDEGLDAYGIGVGIQDVNTTAVTSGGVSNALISRNKINGLASTSTIGFTASGIAIAGDPLGPNTISNNMISGVSSPATAPDLTDGIFVAGVVGSTTRLYHNSISMTGDRSGVGTSAGMLGSFGVAISGTNPTVELKNNIFYTTQIASTGGANAKSYSIGMASATFGALNSNFNDFFASGANAGFFRTGSLGATGTDLATLAAWQTATAQDAGSFAVDPTYVDPLTNLHLQTGSPMINVGTTGTGVLIDFDGDIRPQGPAPEIGADEIVPVGAAGVLAFSSPTYTVGEAGPTATITVNRTGGTSGTVTVDFATVAGGTATGGAACTAGIDYINASGTLTFINGDASETFNVTICNDPTDEPDETINMALTNPTGGATIGTQSTAVLTITDDDPAPTTFSVAIGDARVTEGNAGTVNMTFNVTLTSNTPTLTENLGGIASVQFATANGTASSGSDYAANSGTINFNTTGTQTVTVIVNGDTTKESNEFLFVNLSNPSINTTITDGQGAGIIVDEDRPYVADFDRDIKADFSVFRPSTAVWYVLQSSNLAINIGSAGPSGDVAVPGDYDGDGKTDFAAFQNSSGNWFILRSSDSGVTTTTWGVPGDKPVQGDYDGDGKTDLAVFRPSTGEWWILRSATSTSITVTFGVSTDRLVQGEYDGDFKTDIAVYRNGTWFVLRSSDGSVQISNWGLASDQPLSGDFDGDGRNDLAVYRSGVWWILNSLSGTANVVPFGLGTDVPAPADFDGDGTTDLVVFRGSTGDWYVLRSSDSVLTGANWGVITDVPVPAAYIPQ